MLRRWQASKRAKRTSTLVEKPTERTSNTKNQVTNARLAGAAKKITTDSLTQHSIFFFQFFSCSEIVLIARATQE